MSKITYPVCGQTEAQIAQLKKQHGDVYLITVKDKTTSYQSLHKRPGIQVLDAFLQEAKKAPLGAFALLFNSTMLAKDTAFDDSPKGEMLAVKAGRQLNDVLDDLSTELKNL